MPLHDLECPVCEHKWEDLCEVRDNKVVSVECPHCRRALGKIVINSGPTVMGHAREKIMNRASNPPDPPVKVYMGGGKKK